MGNKVELSESEYQEARSLSNVPMNEATLRASIMIQREIDTLRCLLSELRSGVMACKEWPDVVMTINDVVWQRRK